MVWVCVYAHSQMDLCVLLLLFVLLLLLTLGVSICACLPLWKEWSFIYYKCPSCCMKLKLSGGNWHFAGAPFWMIGCRNAHDCNALDSDLETSKGACLPDATGVFLFKYLCNLFTFWYLDFAPVYSDHSLVVHPSVVSWLSIGQSDLA